MLRIILTLLMLGGWLAATTSAATAQSEEITLSLPEAVLAETIEKSLPIELDTSSESIGGRIVIERIENLKLGAQKASVLLGLSGTDVKIDTAIAGHQLRLNIGNVELEFALDAAIRYDQQSRTLFITPTVTDLAAQENQTSNDIGSLLIALFSGREFPVEINQLPPIVSDTGSKKLAIDLDIKQISIADKALVLHLVPTVRAQK